MTGGGQAQGCEHSAGLRPAAELKRAKATREPWLRTGTARALPSRELAAPGSALVHVTHSSANVGRAISLLCVFTASIASPGTAATPFKKALSV